MRLEKFSLYFWGNKTDKLSLDERPLKKIIAVGDEHWRVIYAPLFDVVNRCFSVFGVKHEKLNVDFVDQLVRVVRRSKGVVQEDSLLIHVNTYALVLCFTSLYLARLMLRFEVHAIGVGKDNKGERSIVYPWLHIPKKVDIKLKKLDVIPPVYLLSLPLLSSLVSSDVSWDWLYKNPDILKSVLDACTTNGEKGSLSGLLVSITLPVIDSEPADRQNIINVDVATDQDKVTTPGPSIDDLISGLGEEVVSTPSIEDLLAGGATSGEESKKNAQATNVNKPDNSLGSDTNKQGLEPSTNSVQPISAETIGLTNDDSVIEPSSVDTPESLQAEFLDLISNDDEAASQSYEQEANNVEVGAFGSEATISSDMLVWANKELAESKCGITNVGVLAVIHNEEFFIGLEAVAFLSFAKCDYVLDDESAYQRVADEIRSDFIMSGDWLPKDDGGEIWSAEKDGQKKDVMLIPVKQGMDFIKDKESIYRVN